MRWLGLVAYRQLGWAYHALRERRLGPHLRALAAAIPLLGYALAERRRLSSRAVVPISAAIPARPIRGGRRAQRAAGATSVAKWPNAASTSRELGAARATYCHATAFIGSASVTEVANR